MLEMIEDRKGSTVLEERQDLLSNLIRASMQKSDSQEQDFEFTHRDLLGNIFIFLLASKHFRCQCSRFFHSSVLEAMRPQRVLYRLL